MRFNSGFKGLKAAGA